jgi:excisionase family DNA binding protein
MMSHLIQENTEQPADWLTVPELAGWFRVGKRSVFRAISRGDLRAARVNERGDLRISRAWALDWVERNSA